MSADQYHVTISRAQVKSSSRSRAFFKLTTYQAMGFLLDCGLKPGYFSRGECRRTCKGKISAKLELWRFVDYSSWYNFYNLGYTLGLLKCSQKRNSQTSRWTTHAHCWSFFQFLILEKILSSFMVNYCNQGLRFLGLAKSTYYLYVKFLRRIALNF